MVPDNPEAILLPSINTCTSVQKTYEQVSVDMKVMFDAIVSKSWSFQNCTIASKTKQTDDVNN